MTDVAFQKKSTRYFSLLLAVLGMVLTLNLAFTSQAFAKTTEEKWTVEFAGTEMKDSNSADIAKVVSNMQPGDSASFVVSLYESWDKPANWFMRNEVLKSMEESFDDVNSNSGGSYSYKLTYTAPDGQEKVILTNDVVSGDAGSGSTKGLFDATEATGEWFYLDCLQPETRATVRLDVAIDGESHTNAYFDTNAKLQLSFAAEPTKEQAQAETKNPPAADKPTTKQEKPTASSEKASAEKAPASTKKLSQTGDMLPLATLGIVAFGAAITAGVAYCRRNRKNEEGESR